MVEVHSVTGKTSHVIVNATVTCEKFNTRDEIFCVT